MGPAATPDPVWYQEEPRQRSDKTSKILGAIVGGMVAALIAVGVWWLMARPPETSEAVGPAPSGPTQQSEEPTTAATTQASTGPTASATTSASSTGSPTSSPTSPPATSPSSPTDIAAAASLAKLQATRDATVTQVRLDGRWVAQLASKYDGVVDPNQTTASGSHTFGYPDILAEYESIRAVFGDGVLLLQGTDFGRQVSGRKAIWVTLYDGGFRSQAQAQAWCGHQFPGLTGKALANKCVVRSLRAPHR